jgi:hypothetical protein
VDAFDFYDEAQGIGGAVVDGDGEAGEVDAVFGGVTVGDAEAEALVFDVGEDPRVGFGDAAEVGFPVAV